MESWRNRKTLILSRTDMMGLLTPAEYSRILQGDPGRVEQRDLGLSVDWCRLVARVAPRRAS
jgi:hypothetical protein